ncbi:hypothetical protein B10881_11000 [Campylobacter jejuni]|nr:hypothetical protein B10881_11000 [Campylobacter jejuni]GML43904.1 hypothetical protein B11111_00310 [Campylobacter jejuni]
MFCEKIAVFKTCIYHYEFNPNGRYENKNKEILNQNYHDKKKSNEIIRNLSNDFKYEEFNKKILENLEKDIDALKSRINFYPSSLQSFINF